MSLLRLIYLTLANIPGQLLEAELGKEIKKPPVVEFKIPKKVFLPQEPGSTERDRPLVRLWEFDA